MPMLISVGAFCDRVSRDLEGLVSDLQLQTSREGPDEASAWRDSFRVVASTFDTDECRKLHLHIQDRRNLSLEYRLPAANAWCDMVVLGKQRNARPAAVFFELKHWDIGCDTRGRAPSLVRHAGSDVLHPSAQVESYVDYCRHFHSAVQARDAELSGCSWLTRATNAGVYAGDPYQSLVDHYPVFTRSAGDLRRAIPGFLHARISDPDEGWASEFEQGHYRQDRNLIRKIASGIDDSTQPQFVLLDAQRVGFELCRARISAALDATRDRKLVFLIEGPPGSGKSVIAAKLWAEFARDPRLASGDGCAFVSTSGSQKSNWCEAMTKALGSSRARSVVVSANEFNPGMNSSWANNERAHGREASAETWRENLLRHRVEGKAPPIRDAGLDIAIVDEAHALIDPTVAATAGAPMSGWTIHAGPQAYHILRGARFAVFLLDPKQRYRDNETTTSDRIIELAQLFGDVEIERISLEGAQFRCGGSAEYVAWTEAVLGLAAPEGRALGHVHASDHAHLVPAPTGWRKTLPLGKGVRAGRADSDEIARGNFRFELVDDPQALDEALEQHLRNGRTVRLLASYAVPWKTKADAKEAGLGRAQGLPIHDWPENEKDFYLDYQRGGQKRIWSRVWNFVDGPAGGKGGPRYDYFIQAPPNTPIGRNPLAEVGCPYVVRGWDFDYVGILWLDDLVWRTDRWVVQIEHVHESAVKNLRSRAKREIKSDAFGPNAAELTNRLRRAYRILLTRAIRGAYVWVKDEETRAHLHSALRS